MFNISPEILQETLKQVDQAIYNHQQWHTDLMRTLICRLPYDHRDVVDDAHRQCRFGQWYYSGAPEELRDHAGFIAIEPEHESLHRLAARLLQASANEAPVSPHDYDNFDNTRNRLILQLQSLRFEIEDSLYNRDPLTGAESRIGMLIKLRELHALVKRGAQRCCIAMMDLDHFKAVNDTFGHVTGDQVLAASVRLVKEHLRPYDKIFRYGGEEFLVSMPNSDLQAGHAVIERIREQLAATVIAHDGPKPVFITASFGITLLDPDVNIEESIDRVDKAMYAAKVAGRNHTCIWDPSMTPG